MGIENLDELIVDKYDSSSKIRCLYVDTCKMFGLEINEENYYSFEECSRER